MSAESHLDFIVHADDFGISESVNECINTCFKQGVLSETSLMVNMPACEAAVDLARRGGYAYLVGFHLNLTQGKPLTAAIRERPLFCNEDGLFNARFHNSVFHRIYLSEEDSVAACEEIEAQIKKFCSYAGFLKGIDSHHHSHTDWAIYRLLKPLSIKYGFQRMRLSMDLSHVRLPKRIYKAIFNREVRRHFETANHFGNVSAICSSGGCVVMGGAVEVMVPLVLKDGQIYDTNVLYERSMELLRTVPHANIRTL